MVSMKAWRPVVGGALVDLEALGERGDEFSAVHGVLLRIGGFEAACSMPPNGAECLHRRHISCA